MTIAAQVTPYPRRTVRALVTAQLATIGAFLAVVLLYLARMATDGVGPAEMRTGAHDPKDVIPFGMDGTNPFLWLYAAVSVLYLVGAVLSPPLAIAAVAVVAREREALPRVTRALLLTGAVGGVLVLVARFTPPLLDMQAWWLD